MNEQKKPSLFIILLAILIFGFTTFAPLYWFLTSTYHLIHSLIYQSPTVVFNSAAMNMLGGGLCSLSFFIGSILTLRKKEVSHRISLILMKSFVVNIVIMFTLPYILYYPVRYIITVKNNYVECEGLSSHSFKYNKYVYTKNTNTCVKLVDKQQ